MDSSCIAIGRNEDGYSQIVQIDIVHDILDQTFDQILFENLYITTLWDLNENLNENALSNIPEVSIIYETLSSMAPSIILSSLKLAAGL